MSIRAGFAAAIVAMTVVAPLAPRVALPARATCPDPHAPAPLHTTATGFIQPDGGDRAAGCAPQPVDSNVAVDGHVLTHPCDGDDPTDDTDTSRVGPSWIWVNDQPQRASGVVAQGGAFVAASDFPLGHDSHDLNVLLAPDDASRGLMATGNYRSGGVENDRFELEWEAGRFEGRGEGDWLGRNRGPSPLPFFVWPFGGDRVTVVGQWIFDCAHTYYDAGTRYNYRTEIHPPQWMVVSRASQSTGVGDRPAVRYDVYGRSAAERSWETEFCNSIGLMRAYEVNGTCGLLPMPPRRDIDVDLYPPGTVFDGWGTPTARPPAADAVAGYRFVDRGKGALDPSWVTVLADHVHLHVPLASMQALDWGGSFDVYWETAAQQPAAAAYVLTIDSIYVRDNQDAVGCSLNGGDWRIWAAVNGEWQEVFDRSDGVCDDTSYHLGKAFTVSELPPGEHLRLWASGYEKDGIDSCFGGLFLGCGVALADNSDNPGVVQRGYSTAASAALKGWLSAAAERPQGSTDEPSYTLSYIVQPKEVFDTPHASAEFIGPDAHVGPDGFEAIGPRDAIRLWEPGARAFTANEIRYKVWADGSSEPPSFSVGAGVPFDLRPPFGLADSAAGVYHLRFDALLAAGNVSLPQNVPQSLAFRFDPRQGVDVDPPTFAAYRIGGLPVIAWNADQFGAGEWVIGSKACSIFNPFAHKPLCGPVVSDAGHLTVIAADASPIARGSVTRDGSTVTCNDQGGDNCFQAISGDGSIFWTITLPSDGHHLLVFSATDSDPTPPGCGILVCHPETGSASYAVDVDLHDPTATVASIVPGAPDGNGGWYVTPPTLRFSGHDVGSAGSGLEGVEVTIAPPPFSDRRVDAEGHPVRPEGDAPLLIQPGEPLTIAGDAARTVAYSAVDRAGRHSVATSFVVKVDAGRPRAHCAAADQVWHGANVELACAADDVASGLADPGDASFTLATAVAAGSEDAHAETGSRTVCDIAGNCRTTGPREGGKVDLKPPSISLVAPRAGTYRIGQKLVAHFHCADAGSGVASCVGPVGDGRRLGTASPGARHFTIRAADGVRNAASATVGYTLTYGVCRVRHSARRASVTIRLELCDVAQHDVSSAPVAVRAATVDGRPLTPVERFAFDRTAGRSGSYRLVLRTRGLTRGSHMLGVVAAGDPVTHRIGFVVS